MATFDLTFDHTFQGLLLTEVTPSETDPDCDERKPGVYLTWLSQCGWMYWLFSGFPDYGADVSAPSQFEQGGLIRNPYRETRDTTICRTEGLSFEEWYAVSTVQHSISVYAMAPDADGIFHAVPVSVDYGSVPSWKDSQNRAYLEIKISYPSRRSQRV